MKKQKNWTAIIFIFIIMAMIAVVDNTKGIFVPAFKRQFGVDDNSISNMFIISSAAYMLFSYIGGILSEKIGQKNVYILGILLNIISLFLLSASKTFMMLLVGVGLSSGGVALIAIASNTIIPIIVITAQAVIMNMMHFCFAIGSSIGQVVFGNLYAAGIGWRKIYFYVAIIYIILLFITFTCLTDVSAQADRQSIRSGNKLYRMQEYSKAEAEYRKAVAVTPDNPQALYNLGCALMMQQKDSAAVEEYQKAARVEKNAMRKAKIFHNIGVICQNRKMFAEAISAYKESLRINPDDNETRYNLALCKRQQKNSQNKPQQNNKDDKQNKNNKEKQQKQKTQQKQDTQQKQEQMSKDNAEQLLNAAMQAEKETKKRMQNESHHSRSRKLEKNW